MTKANLFLDDQTDLSRYILQQETIHYTTELSSIYNMYFESHDLK